MLECPNCRSTRLVRLKNQFGFFWVCPKCNGRAVSMSLLKKTLSHKFLSNLWNRAFTSKGALTRRCPMCGKYMYEICAEPETPKLDVCQLCQFIWFDPMEYEQSPEEPPPPVTSELKGKLPSEAMEKLALQLVKKVEEDARRKDNSTGFQSGDLPGESWKYLPAMFGMPVEYDNDIKNMPLATWSFVALITIISVLAFNNLNDICALWGFIPNEPLRAFGLTFLTAFFLHGGWLHLLSNMYFLLIFGDNVEDFLGARKLILLLLAAAFAGNLLHMIFDCHPGIPCIGASGGISGIITFYALQFPNAKLGLLIRLGYMFRWVSFPAYAALIVWILLQSFGAWEQLNGFTNVSALAHLGGTGVGLAAWIYFRKGRPEKESQS